MDVRGDKIEYVVLLERYWVDTGIVTRRNRVQYSGTFRTERLEYMTCKVDGT